METTKKQDGSLEERVCLAVEVAAGGVRSCLRSAEAAQMAEKKAAAECALRGDHGTTMAEAKRRLRFANVNQIVWQVAWDAVERHAKGLGVEIE